MLDPTTFTKCAPSIATNIKQCGTVTICDAKPLTYDDLSSVYLKSGDFRVMDAILRHDMEIKQCEAVQNGLYDFLMANKVNLSKRINSQKANSGLIRIAPFVLARQYSPINNEYWLVSGGTAAGAGDWAVDVTSATNIPADVRSFPVGQRVFIAGKSAGGSATHTAWVIAAVTDNGDDTLTLNLTAQNSASQLDADKLESPVTGLMMRGTANVNDFEKFCAEPPAYLNWKDVPFWFETSRTSMCKSSLYDEYRKLLMEGNPMYREFGDLDDIAKNKQLGADWQKRLVNQFFRSKPLANQTLGDYDQLEDIETFDGSSLNLGVDGGRCIGKRANVVGIYEQLAECGRVIDLQDSQLNLPALFREFYNILRIREGIGNNNTVIDVFVDSVLAEKINSAMISYYKDKGQDMLRLNMPVNTPAKKAKFGFNYRSYELFWPQGLVMNVITHRFFDDYIAASALAGQEAQGRVLWVLDFAGIYPGIIASNRVVHKTGDLKTLASVNPDFACVMRVPTQEQTLVSLTYTVVVECGHSNLVIEGISDEIPEGVTDNGATYNSAGTTTTTAAP